MKRVSVVVPCYNASLYLHKCIDHLLHQTIGLENMEIILVDDASTDDGRTWKIITDYEKQYPDAIIAIHLEENLRQGGARNVGVLTPVGSIWFFVIRMSGFSSRPQNMLIRQRRNMMQMWWNFEQDKYMILAKISHR